MLTDEEIKQVEDEAYAAIDHLQMIKRITEGKDNNVAFLADYRSKDIETIVRCAKMKDSKLPG